MARRAPDLDALAAALADGSAVDWEAVESVAETPEDRDRLRRLRTVAQIIQAYRGSAGLQPFETATDDVPERLPPGTRWGSLRIVEYLGSGTFGDVYRARDSRLDRDVALKVSRGRDPVDGDLQTEAVHEGSLMARVRHPNVATVYGADCVDGRAGVWMEVLEGRALEDELLERGPLPANEVAAIGGDLCRALTAVHDAGLVHRDVKTQNVMRDGRQGRVVLMDFSAGREHAETPDPDSHVPVSLAGSPIYLAPEVLAGQSFSPRSDLYSLGVLLFRLASGTFPVTGTSLAEIRKAHAAGCRTRLSDLRPGLPAQLVDAIERAISANPQQRFASARKMERALRVLTRRRHGSGGQ